MKILILLSLSALVACSSGQKVSKISDRSWDALAQETFSRWGEERLAEYNAKDGLVVGCYQGKVKETLNQYKAQYDKRESNPHYWLHIGNCYYLSQDDAKARFFYQLAMEESASPDIKAMAHNNLALLALKKHDWEEGRQHLKKAITFSAQLKIPKFNLSQLYLQFGHYDDAIALLQGSEWQNQNDADLFFSLGNGYLFKGDLEKAGFYFNKIPKENFKREDYAITYSLFYLKKGDLVNAKGVLKGRSISSVVELKSISSKLEAMIDRRMKK